MSERAAAYRSFKLAFILVGCLISVPVLSMVIMSVTADNIENVWAPLQPVGTGIGLLIGAVTA